MTDPVDTAQPGPEPDVPEAIRWRRQLRETEAQRDQLAAQVEQLQRTQIEVLLDREHITPAGLWSTTTLNDLLTDGLVDPVKVQSAAATTRERLGIGLHDALYIPAEGKVPAPPQPNRFQQAFTPQEKRRP